MTLSEDSIQVLHVDDEPDFAELTAQFLENTGEALTVETAPNASDAIDLLEQSRYDCVISDYDMPEQNGIEFLENVREKFPELPFILFTGKGSEEVASDAIAAGITDYLQKRSGTDQYELLANRVRNAVERHRASQVVSETEKWARTLLEYSSDYLFVVDNTGQVAYASPSIRRVMGYDPDEVIGSDPFELVHEDDLHRAREAFAETLDPPNDDVTVEFRAKHADGSYRWLEVRGRNLLEDPVIEGVLVNGRDVTERKERERDLQQERERFAALYNNFPEPTITYEFVNDEPIIKAVNDAFVKVFGHETAAAVGEPVDELIVPEDKLEQAQAIDDRVRAGELIDAELTRKTAAGIGTSGSGTFPYRVKIHPTDSGSIPTLPNGRSGSENSNDIGSSSRQSVIRCTSWIRRATSRWSTRRPSINGGTTASSLSELMPWKLWSRKTMIEARNSSSSFWNRRSSGVPLRCDPLPAMEKRSSTRTKSVS